MSLRDRAKALTEGELLDETELRVEDGEGSYKRIPIDSIYSTAQVRKRFKNIEEMAASLDANGQEQPIIVCPMDSKGYRIQKGERRWRGAKLSKTITHLDCIIKSKGDIYGQIVENIQRDNLDPIELGEALAEAKVMDGLNNRQLAEKVGKSEGYVSKYVNAITAPQFVLDAYLNEIIGDVESINELRKAAQVDSDKTEAFLSHAKTITRQEAIQFKNGLSAKPQAKTNPSWDNRVLATFSDKKMKATCSMSPDKKSLKVSLVNQPEEVLADIESYIQSKLTTN